MWGRLQPGCYGQRGVDPRSSRPRGLRLALLLGLAAAGGCRAPDSTSDAAYTVTLADLQTRSAGSRVDDRAWQTQTLEDALEGADMFRVGDRDALEVQAEVLEVRTAHGLVVRVALSMDVPQDLTGVLDELEAVVEVERAQGDSAIREDLPMAADRAAAVLDAKVQLARTPQTVDALLRSPDAELALIALDWVEAQRVRSAAAVVAEMLRHPDDRVMLRAVEVIGVVGSASEVGTLIAAARLSDRAHTGRLYEALAALGGPEAEGFLGFAARNEDDPALARLAERALDEAQRTVPRTPPAAVAVPRGHR